METVIAPDTSPRVRLLAVLAADAVGYSRLMSLDDQGTVAALDAARAVFRDAIAAHAGRVIDMAGDSVLAVFENATAAVQAALTIQRQLNEGTASEVHEDRRMRFRIGVHLGDVIEKADGSVYGDGVNIAARLESLAAPGGVAVSEPVRSTVRGRLEASFEDQGAQRVKNIADPVKVFAVSPSSTTPGAQGTPAAASALTPNVSNSNDDLDGEPSIAVLPFESADHGPEQAGFADGLVDDIIGSLASVSGLVVIARSSTYTYKGRGADARTVGMELGVRYVVEGSLRVMARRLRLNVTLVDCRTHGSLWSERFDAPVEDLCMVQDEITARIMNSIRVTIGQAEARTIRRLTPQSLRAWQLRAQAVELFYRWNRAEMLQSVELSRRAIELEPDNATGYVYLATSLWAGSISGWMPSGTDAFNEALQTALRAINLDEGLAGGHNILASVLIGLRRYDEAIAAAERAYELAPGDSVAASQVGQTLAFAGRYEEALPYLDRALRLSPKDPMIYWVYQSRSIALFGLERYEEMIAAAQRVSRQLPQWVDAHTLMAAGYMALGKTDLAALSLNNATSLDSRLTVRRVMRRQPMRDEAAAQRLAGFLRATGLAEG
jgi:adenylate cyclase